MRAHGVVLPLIVAKINSEDGYTVVDGNHRLQALQLMGESGDIPVVILPENIDEQAQYQLIFDINKQYAEYVPDKVVSVLKKYEEFRSPDALQRYKFPKVSLKDFIPDNFQPTAPDPLKTELFDKKIRIRAALEKVLLETEDQLASDYLVFAHNQKTYFVVEMSQDEMDKLYEIRRENPVHFKEILNSGIMSVYDKRATGDTTATEA